MVRNEIYHYYHNQLCTLTCKELRNLTWSDASRKLIFKYCGMFFDLCLMQCWMCMGRCWAMAVSWILNLKQPLVCLHVSMEYCMKRAVLTVGNFLMDLLIISNIILVHITAITMVACFDLVVSMALGTLGCEGIAMLLCELIDGIYCLFLTGVDDVDWRWR